MPLKRFRIQQALPGMTVTGLTGGLIGFFMGEAIWIVLMALVGALLGAVVWLLGGQRFFLFIVGGAVLGAALAFYLSGVDFLLMGASAGGSMGGFLAVNLGLFTPREIPPP